LARIDGLTCHCQSAIAAADGGQAHSAEAVRHRIRQLIDAENPDQVLSDDTIVEKLREAGIVIARRTVAKYREAMGIASSVQRRREKQTSLLGRDWRQISTVDLHAYANVKRWYTVIAKRPAVQRG
jgi:hypothetical protein